MRETPPRRGARAGRRARTPCGGAAAAACANPRARRIQLGAVLDEQLQERNAAASPHGMRERRHLARIRPRLEQPAHRLDAVVVERVRERVRPVRLGTVVEQDAQARRIARLARVIERVAAGRLPVRIGAGLEQELGQRRTAHDTGRAEERGDRPVLVRRERIGIGAGREQLPRELERRVERVRDVVERRPGARAAALVRIPVPAAPEDKPDPALVGDLRPGGEHRLRPPTPVGRRRQDELRRARILRMDESGPARKPGLPREHELRAREADLQVAQTGKRPHVTAPRRADELLRLLP